MDNICTQLPSGRWKWTDQVNESIVFDDETACILADANRNKTIVPPVVVFQGIMPPEISTPPTILINPLEAVPFFSKSLT